MYYSSRNLQIYKFILNYCRLIVYKFVSTKSDREIFNRVHLFILVLLIIKHFILSLTQIAYFAILYHFACVSCKIKYCNIRGYIQAITKESQKSKLILNAVRSIKIVTASRTDVSCSREYYRRSLSTFFLQLRHCKATTDN